MKHFAKLFLTTALSIGALSAAPAHALSVTEQESAAREQISAAYNVIAGWDAVTYASNMQKTADNFEARGDLAKANALRALAQPQMQNLVLEKMKTSIDDKSQNGLGWLIALPVCAIDSALGNEGWNCLAWIVIGFYTLDGDAAQAF